MASNINEIKMSNQSSSMSKYMGSKLSESTKQQLEELGIDPRSVTSEAQAKQLIEDKKAEQAKKEEAANQKKNSSPSEQQLISDAKSLAAKVGVSVSEEDSIDDILESISSKISAMYSEAKASGDEEKIAQAKSFSGELEILQVMANSIQQNQAMLDASMNALSYMNKMTLGL